MHNLTTAEWQVLSFLWENGKSTGKEVCLALEKSAGWNRSTTLTVLRRMEKKGMVQLDDSQKLQRFSAAVPQERATLQETRSFIDRVYHGSLGLMLTTLTEKKELSAAEVVELRAILERAGSDDV